MKIRVIAGTIAETFGDGEEEYGRFVTEADEVRDLPLDEVVRLVRLPKRDVLRLFGPGHRNVIVLNRVNDGQVQIVVKSEAEVEAGTIPDRKN